MIPASGIVTHPETGLSVLVRWTGRGDTLETRDTVYAHCLVLDVETGHPTSVTCTLPLAMLEKWSQGHYGPDDSPRGRHVPHHRLS